MRDSRFMGALEIAAILFCLTVAIIDVANPGTAPRWLVSFWAVIAGIWVYVARLHRRNA